MSIALGALLALGLAPAPAYAHAELSATTPSDGAALEVAPATVKLEFNESVQPVDGGFSLYDGDTLVADLSASSSDNDVKIKLPAELGSGSFTVTYRVISVDGHPIAGVVAFTVGNVAASEQPDVVDASAVPLSTSAALVALTIGQYLGVLLLSGALLIRVFVTGPSSVLGMVPLARRGAGLAALASALLIPVLALRALGGELWQLFTPVWLGGVGWAPIVGAGLIFIVAFAVYADPLQSRGAAMRIGLVALSVEALVAPLLVGHALAQCPQWLMLITDLVHLAAGALWFSGVIGLIVLARSHRNYSADIDEALTFVSRFSKAAAFSVLVLSISGITLASSIVGSLVALTQGAYGRTLLLKITVVLAVLAIAWWNRRLIPKISRSGDPRRQWAMLHQALRYEAAILCVVLAITGVLSNMSPTHSAPASPAAIEISVRSQGMTVTGALSNSRPGSNTITFTLRYDATPVVATEVTVTAKHTERGIGPIEASVQVDAASGNYTAQLTLPVEGTWTLQFSARVSTYTAPIAIAEVTITE